MKTAMVTCFLFLTVGCVGAEPNAADVGGGYYPPPNDTYQPPPDNGSDGSDATDATDANDGSDGAEDTYQPPKEDTVQTDSSTGPQEGDPCDDGNQCTASDCWHDGECVGKEVSCDDNDADTTDYCDPESGCHHVVEQPECKDSVACTVDVIEDGVCKHKPTAGNCDDGNACTTDSCNAATGCSYVTKTCDDGKECTTDSCNTVTGGCKAVENCASGSSCGAGGQCIVDVPENGTSCDDNNACTTADRWLDGVCKGTGTKNCNDEDPCTTDSCNAATGCVNTEKACGDGKSCTTDWCSQTTGGCVHEENCDDGKSTTADSCNASGECVHTNIQTTPQVGDSCNDNDSCTVSDVIVAGGQCVGVAKCAANQTCSAGICYDSVPVSPYKEVMVKWYPTFNTYHASFMGWFCKGGTLTSDGTSATGCSNYSEWKEFAKWNGNPNPSQLTETFFIPKGSWLFFNPLFNLTFEGANSDWCDSPTGFSTGVSWEVWVDGAKLPVTLVSNKATGCNGRVWIPN